MTEPRPPRDPFGDDALRALLDDAVSDVEPRPALDALRNRTKVIPMSRRPWILAAVGAVAATAATVTAVSILSNDPTDPSGADGGPATGSTNTPGPTEEPTDETPPTEEPSEEPTGGTESVALPIYYVGDTPAGPRLYREFHAAEVPAGPTGALTAALESALAGDADDPDYGSPWAGLGATLDEASVAPDVVTISLSGTDLAERPAALGEPEASAAVEQLIYTARAVLQQEVGVQFLVEGQRTLTVLGLPTNEPLAAGPADSVLASVWILSPTEGESVDVPIRVEGQAAAFEATVSWQLLQDGEVVKDGFTTARECCTLSPYSFRIRGVAPGEYVLRVYEADMSGGEGPGESEDTKTIVVP